MEDKKTALAVFLCIVVVMVYMQVMFPADMKRPEQQAQQTSSQTLQPGTSTSAAGSAVTQNGQVPVAQTAAQTHVSDADLQASSVTKIETGVLTVELNHLGARLSSIKLKNYRRRLHEPELLDLVAHSQGEPLPLGLYTDDGNDEAVKYTLIKAEGSAALGDGKYNIQDSAEVALVFEGQFGAGKKVTKVFKFKGDSYLFGVNATISGSGEKNPLPWLEWTHVVSSAENDQRLNPETIMLLDLDKKLQRFPVASMKPGVTPVPGGVWVGFTDSYFMAALVPPVPAQGDSTIGKEFISLTPESGDKKELLYSRVSAAVGSANFSVYTGPKDYQALNGLGYDLHRSIDLGFFSFLAYPLLMAMRIFDGVLGNYGLAIILLTLVIKLILLPLTKAQIESSRKMADIQPEVKLMRERIKDATQLNQEMLALYKKRGVNPMGGCLPILIQIPVFFGLFSALRNSIELRHAGFALWITDLSAPEKLHIYGVGIPVMVLLMGISMFLQQRTMPQALDAAQQKAMTMMPVVFTIMFVIFPMPAGLTLYWLVSNVISIIQQEYIRNDKKASPLSATVVASVGIFALGYVLTLF